MQSTNNNSLKLRSLFYHTSIFAIAMGMCLSEASALPPAPPTSVDPALVEKRFDDKPAPLPSSNIQNLVPAVSQQPSPKVQAEMAKKRFLLKQVVVEGNTVYSNDQLKFAYEGYLNKEISLVDAQVLVKKITDFYRNNGYILSQAIVPPQNIKGGVLHVRVVEGFINNVIIEGELKESSGRKIVESYGEHIKEKHPINIADLERYLLLIDDLPGATAKGLVRPSPSALGGADLVVTLTHKMFEASYTADNRGSKFVGPFQHTATVAANSLFGMYDRTLFRVITTSPTTELRFFDLQHEEQLDSEGTRLVLDASHSHTRPGDALKSADIVGDSDFLQAKAVHPFIRSREENLVGRIMFDVRNTTTDFSGINFSNDRLRVVRAGGNYDFPDAFMGVNLIDTQISHGLNIFGATDSGVARSNSHGDADFTKLNLDLSRTQILPHDFSIFAAASGQYAFEPLLAAEQFTIGGPGFGEAYDPAELSGDNGIGAKLELRYGQTLGDPFINSYQVYTFYDIGRTWVQSSAPGADNKRSLASAGIGLRTNFLTNFSGDFEVARPLTKDVANQGNHGDGTRLFFSITGRF